MTDTRQPQGLIHASDYALRTLVIVTSTGDAVDVHPILLSMDIYEDIFSPCMTGQLVLGDGADILSNYQLHGNEYLLLSVDKPSLNMPIVKTLRIYKASNRKMDDTALQNYTLHFCSEELFLSSQMSLSISYKGMTISDMVKDILTNRLQAPITKVAVIETTQGSFDYIIPRMQPLEAIAWLTPRGYAANENLFLFYENRDGFNFRSYESLLKQPVYTSYVRKAKINADPAQNMGGFNELVVQQDFDIIKAMRFGAYASSLITIDLLQRTQNVAIFGYNQVASSGLLNGNIPDNGLQNRLGYTKAQSYASMIKIIPSTDSDPTVNPQLIKNWMPQQIARLGQINTYKMIMSIPGDVLMKAGLVVNVQFPKMVPQQKSIVTDSVRTGNYLVSAVHHKFTQDIMATVIELLSDSVGVPLRAAQNGLSAVQTLVSS